MSRSAVAQDFNTFQRDCRDRRNIWPLRTGATDLHQCGTVTAFGVDENESLVGRHAAQCCRPDECTTIRNRLTRKRVRRNQRLDDVISVRERHVCNLIGAKHIHRHRRIHDGAGFAPHTGDDDFLLDSCFVCRRLIVRLCIGDPPGDHHTNDR